MKNHAFSVIAALFIAGSAHAKCDGELQVNVLPFEVTRDFTKTFRELQDLGIAVGEVGLVRATSTLRVDGCSVTMGYRDPVLYVASELKRNQCAFEHVLEHEEEHVRIYQRHLSTLAARVCAGVQEGQDPFEVAKRELLAVRAEHAAHDSPEEYEKNRTECGGRIAKLTLGR